MLRIKLAEVFVDDQDKAKAFYTDKLGFQVGTDMSVGSYRWLTVVSRDNAGGLELLLSQGDDAAKAFQAARRESGTPV